MQADIQKALEASRAERKTRDDWRSRYSDLERQIEELSPSASASPPFPAWEIALAGAALGAAIVALAGGLI